jgi:hypothetical protein
LEQPKDQALHAGTVATVREFSRLIRRDIFGSLTRSSFGNCEQCEGKVYSKDFYLMLEHIKKFVL